MVNVVPHVTDWCALDDAKARQLWNWLLRRQGLSAETRLRSVEEIAEASLGLHAARLPSPYATLLARSENPAVALTLFSASTRRLVTTVRCMRKTLHVLPLELAVAAHSATMHFRERDALRAVTNAGMSARQVTRSTDAIIRFLEANGPAPRRDIEARLTAGGIPAASARVALRLAWERGTLSYQNDMIGWNRACRKFSLTQLVYPTLDMSMDRSKATNQLLEAYFDRYGPASLRDAMWWSGLSRMAVVTALNESAREIVAVETPWADQPLYMYRDRLHEYATAAVHQVATGVNFLAHEDVALKAYFESRRRYLGSLPPRRAFNQIGEVLPTIVFDGQVVGTWVWNARTKTVTIDLVSESRSPEFREALKRSASALTDSLRAGWIDRLDD
ncbi:MAG: winged helix DNA-binding domain-containing protein [Acidobacteria bacterium]|nr:winged helix DNA-binding domain-containing protein [Acidobacteriota bacterium]